MLSAPRTICRPLMCHENVVEGSGSVPVGVRVPPQRRAPALNFVALLVESGDTRQEFSQIVVRDPTDPLMHDASGLKAPASGRESAGSSSKPPTPGWIYSGDE
jgi:hypothetical protein